jgi:alpha-ketoglutarate-dependent taurine dioxygenase
VHDVTALTERLGSVVTARAPGSLPDLAPATVMEVLRARGLVLFRGFGGGVEAFEAFARRFEAGPEVEVPAQIRLGYVDDLAAQVFVNMKRQFSGAAAPLIARGVNPSQAAMHFHSENSYLPFPPELLWFYCLQPARIGGRTKFVDGVRLLEAMPDGIRRFFTEQKVCYKFVWKREQWRNILSTEDVETAQRMLSRLEGVSSRVHPDGSLAVQRLLPAIKPTRFFGPPGFVNSLLHNHDEADSYGLCMEDQTPIPRAHILALRELAESLAVFVAWQPQEFALVDNSRLLHGREAFVGDEQRSLRALEIQHALAS